jgi:hypothetical protein
MVTSKHDEEEKCALKTGEAGAEDMQFGTEISNSNSKLHIIQL